MKLGKQIKTRLILFFISVMRFEYIEKFSLYIKEYLFHDITLQSKI